MVKLEGEREKLDNLKNKKNILEEEKEKNRKKIKELEEKIDKLQRRNRELEDRKNNLKENVASAKNAEKTFIVGTSLLFGAYLLGRGLVSIDALAFRQGLNALLATFMTLFGGIYVVDKIIYINKKKVNEEEIDKILKEIKDNEEEVKKLEKEKEELIKIDFLNEKELEKVIDEIREEKNLINDLEVSNWNDLEKDEGLKMVLKK